MQGVFHLKGRLMIFYRYTIDQKNQLNTKETPFTVHTEIQYFNIFKKNRMKSFS